MERLSTSNIRNVVLVSHGGVGKTTLCESLLFISGVIDRRGTTDAGNTTSDYEPEEIKRKISVNFSIAPIFYKGNKINIIDAPGYFDFIGEILSAMSISDSAILLVSGVAGVEVGTEKIWEKLEENNMPRLIFINRLDRENAGFDKTLDDIANKFSKNFVAISIPIGEQNNLKGVIDLIKMKAYILEDKDGLKYSETDIPDNLKEKSENLREKLIEASAEGDDELLAKYLDGEKLTDEEIILGLKNAVSKNLVVPILCGSDIIGQNLLLQAIVNLLPSPDKKVQGKYINLKTKSEEEIDLNPSSPVSLQIFKTILDPYVGKINIFKVFSGVLTPDIQLYNSTKDKIERISQIYTMRGKTQEVAKEIISGDIGAFTKLQYTSTNDTLCAKEISIKYPEIKFAPPVYSVAVEPKSRGDEEKMSTSLSKLTEEDLTFKIERNTEIKQTIISGIGDLHLDVIMDKLQRKFGVSVITSPPKVPYKETITRKAQAQGKYKRQSGGRGQYGDVWLELEPLQRGTGFEFVDKIVGGVIPKNYIPSVEKGIRDSMQEGPLAGYQVVDIKATLYDGSYHIVDSSDMAFQIAASMGFKKACQDAGMVLLEPIYTVNVIVPQEFMGDIIGDLNGKRGRILGTETKGKYTIITAEVPYAEMLRYTIDLRSKTQGRGSFSMEFSYYEEVPPFIAEKIIAQAKKEREENK